MANLCDELVENDEDFCEEIDDSIWSHDAEISIYGQAKQFKVE